MRRLERGRTLPAPGAFLPAAALVCGGGMMLLIALASILNLGTKTAPAGTLLSLAAGAAAVLGVAAMCRLAPAGSETRFCVCLAVAAFAVRGLFVLLVPAEPLSDFANLFAVARFMAQGHMDALNTHIYFQWWPYQSGYTLWMAFWIWLCGADIGFFQALNCLCGALSAVLVYALARHFASIQGARTAGVLYLLYPGSVILAPVLTNQHLSELLLLAGVCVAVSGENRPRQRLLYGLGAGALLGLSETVRPSAVVAVAAAAVVLLLALFCRRELGREGLLSIAAGALALLGGYALVTGGLSWLVRITGLNQSGLGNNTPLWKFVLGLNQERGGRYSAADAELVFADEDIAAVQEASRRVLAERLAALTPGSLLSLFWRKIMTMWGEFEPTWCAFTQNVMDGYAARGLGEALNFALEKGVRLAAGLYTAGSVLTGAGCLRIAFGAEKKGRGAALLLTLTALAFFCAHLLIEVQTRYRTTLFAVILPLAGAGADGLWALAVRVREKKGVGS